MSRLPVYVNVKHHDDRPANPFMYKWRIDGMAKHVNTSVNVELQDHGALGSIIKTTLGHELGHAEFMRTMSAEECRSKRADVFGWEIAAWIKYVGGANIIPMRLLDGKFILDALNTYRRGHNVSEERWQDARRMIESWSVAPEALAQYEPLEPPPDALPPKGCGEGSLAPMPYDDEEETNDDETETESNDETELDENDFPPPETEMGNDWPTIDHEPPNDEPPNIDRSERDTWLHSGTGMQFTAEGRATLQRELLKRSWDMENLPAITLALLGK